MIGPLLNICRLNYVVIIIILLIKIIGPSLQPTFFIILNFKTDFTIYLFYYLKFPGRVYNKKGNRGPSLHLLLYYGPRSSNRVAVNCGPGIFCTYVNCGLAIFYTYVNCGQGIICIRYLPKYFFIYK